MQALKTKIFALSLVALFQLPLLVVNPVNVSADHTTGHCAVQVGSDTNADYDACVAAIPEEDENIAEFYCTNRFGGPTSSQGELYPGCISAYNNFVDECNSVGPTERDACFNSIATRMNNSYPPTAGGSGPGSDPVDDSPVCDNGEKGVAVSFVTDDGDKCIEFDESTDELDDNPIFVILGRIIQFLLASIGVGLTLVVVIAGFQYMTARGDPQKTASAKNKIAFAITGVVMYALSGALLNWLIPGGII